MLEVGVKERVLYQGVYTVLNRADAPLAVDIEAVDWLERYKSRDETVSPEEWITFKETSFILQPGEIKEVSYDILIPMEMTGEQVAQVFFAFGPADQVGQESFKARIGAILYIGRFDEVSFDVIVDEVKLRQTKTIDGAYDVKANVTLTNNSSVHVRPSGTVRLKMDDVVVAELTMDKKKGIYDHMQDSVEAVGKGVQLEEGTYEVEVELDCGMYEQENTVQYNTTWIVENL